MEESDQETEIEDEDGHDSDTDKEGYKNDKNKKQVLNRLKDILSSEDSTTFSGSAKKWLTQRHLDRLDSWSPFKDKQLDALFRQVVRRQDCQSSMMDIFRHVIKILWSDKEFDSMIRYQITKHPVMKEVAKFVFMDILDQKIVDKRTITCLYQIKQNDLRKKSTHEPLKRGNEIRRRYQAVASLPSDKIKERMEKCIHSIKEAKMRPTPRDFQWFTKKHKKEIENFKVFPTEEMNVLLRQVLQLPSSKKSIRWATINLIKIMWKKTDYKQLVASACLTNPYFEKAFQWVIPPSTPTSSKHIIKNALHFLKK